jgi:hypothetical protein
VHRSAHVAETDFVLPRSITTTPITRFTNFHAKAKVGIRRLSEPMAAPSLRAKMDMRRSVLANSSSAPHQRLI